MWELFAEELRLARAAAGMSQEALGEAIQYSASQVAAVETCRRLPTPDFASRCDEKLNTGGRLDRIRAAIVRTVNAPLVRKWPRVEESANAIRMFEPMLIPGLVQTEDYVRHLMMGRSCRGNDIEKGVVARIARQAVLNKEKPLELFAVFDECAIRREVGSPVVMRDQCMRLLELIEWPNIHIHVVPESAGSYAGLSGPFFIATMPDGRDIGWMDNQLSGTQVERLEDVQVLRCLWEAIMSEALPQKQTVERRSQSHGQPYWRRRGTRGDQTTGGVSMADDLADVFVAGIKAGRFDR